MNFQEKLFETTANLRTRAAAIAAVTVVRTRARADLAVKRIDGLKGTLGVLAVAGRKLNKVVRRHAVSFLRENSAIAAGAGKDVSSLARNTYSALGGKRGAVKAKARKAPAARKHAKAKAA
jgi:hypothetical protein